MPHADFDTDMLVDRARSGDLSSVAVLMQRHRQRLKKMIDARMDPRLRARVDPSDVIQEALTTAALQLSEYLETEPIPFYPWLRRITWQKLVHAHEMHLDAAKRSVRRERQGFWGLSGRSTSQLLDSLDGLPGNTSTPSAAADREESRRRLTEALASLAEIDREVLVQRYVEQMSMKEIGVGLELSEAAVQMRHMRALQKLHKLLTRDIA
jgi:RNA polymerase sigma-70 factor (ECF subfamily)